MTRPVHDDIDRILGFWFGESELDREQLTLYYRRWFSVDTLFDTEIRANFAAMVAAAGSGELEHLDESARGTLAAILLLDQFPRNIYRGRAAAFRFDPQALNHCRRGLAIGQDRELTNVERMFFYLPLQHAEDLDCQRESMHLFQQLRSDADDDFMDIADRCVKFAAEHYTLIERFGRFPHRNAILEREPTAEEREYLASAYRTFGQG